MSSRWDALKPSGNDDGKKGTHRHKGRHNNHASRPSHDFPSRSNQQGRACSAQPKRDKPAWRISPLDNSKGRITDYSIPSIGGEESNPGFRKWEQLTTHLWEWGEQAYSSHATGGSNDTKQLKLPQDRLEVLDILQQLSNILKTGKNQKIIGSKQRGNTLAAAFQTLNFLRDKESIEEVLVWGCNIFDVSESFDQLRQLEVRMTTQQAQKSIEGLLNSRSFLDSENARGTHCKCCLYLVKYCASQLPAEETALHIVGKIMLPAMELSLRAIVKSSHSLTLEAQDEQRMLLLGLQALEALLQVKNQASALFAPLVNEISSEGQELYLANQLRRRTFLLLQNAILCDFTHSTMVPLIDFRRQVYTCLEEALLMANVVDKTQKSGRGPRGSPTRSAMDLDMGVMEKVFQQNLQNKPGQQACYESDPKTSHRKLVLRLLLALLQHHPGASLSIGRFLLLPAVASRSGVDPGTGRQSISKTDYDLHSYSCVCCNQASFSSFLAAVHDSKDSEEIDCGITSLAILVKNISWKLWLGTTSQQIQRRVISTSNFLQRVADSLRNIIAVTKCMFLSFWLSEQQTISRDSGSIVNLVNAALLDIPYESFGDESKLQHTRVIEAAIELVEALAIMLVREDQCHHPLHGRFCDLFEEAMGGRTTPQGTRTVMIIPARTWLSSPASRDFMDTIFNSLGEATNTGKMEVTSKTSARLFRAILTTRPEIVLEDKTFFGNFQRLNRTLIGSGNASLQECGLQILNGFLDGRSCSFPPVSDLRRDELVAFTLQLLARTLQQSAGSCRCLCLQAYGSLLGSDWFLNQNVIRPHLDTVLQSCLGTMPSPVRSAACKSVGDICSNCFLMSEQLVRLDVAGRQQRNDVLKLVAHDVCKTLLMALKDGNAAVRSMAIFALGNLAQVASCSTDATVLDPGTLREACMSAFLRVDDVNDKVAGNAIRCVGHLVAVILRPEYSVSLTQIGWDVDEFCRQVISSLVQRVEAVPVTIVGDKAPGLSWKQRSAAKKHGRVACNSLVLLLKHWSVSESNVDNIGKALAPIVKCLQSLGTTLDDKFVIAAMLVLRVIPSSSLAKVSGKRCIVGNALVPCITFVAQERWHQPTSKTSSKVLEEVEDLCQHLLESASIADAFVVISCEEIVGLWMDNLYQWMVLKRCTARTFDVFAIALQRPGVNVSVSVENKFANRAMSLCRHGGLDEPDSDDEL